MVFCSFVLLVSCTSRDSGEFWGSYTADKTYSHDNKYYALQTVEDNMMGEGFVQQLDAVSRYR